MPSSRRTPRRRKRLRADMESAPTTNGGPAANRAKRGPAVISDLCRGRCLHCARRRVSEANRATGPALRPEIVPRGLWRRKVPREGHGPPLQTMANARPNGKGTRPRAAVGRDALIPPDPAAAGTPAGGINPSPTNHGRPAANRGKRGPAVISGLCRGRCLHCARRRVSEANRATGPALRPEIVPRGPVAAQGSAGGINPSPTNHGERPAKREGHTPPGGRRAGCPHPAAPRGGGNTRGRIWNPPLRPTAGPRPNGQTAALRLYRTFVGDDACIVPGPLRRRERSRF